MRGYEICDHVESDSPPNGAEYVAAGEILHPPKDDEEFKEETLFSFKISRRDGAAGDEVVVLPSSRVAVISAAENLRAPRVRLELHPHVAEVQGVGHAAEHGGGGGEPAVHEEAHAVVAYGEGVEEQRIDEQAGGAY
nr:hypothetical protein ACMD2_07708 [Ipomoea trifida]